MNIGGIDVGKKGAIAILGGGTYQVFAARLIGKQFDEPWMASIVRLLDHAYLEKAQAMPKQGTASMFNYGVGFGLWRMACVAANVPYTLVPPTRWKREMLAGMDRSDKRSSIIRARQLFGDVSLRPTPKCRKDSDGMAEALLIAEYGRRMQRAEDA